MKNIIQLFVPSVYAADTCDAGVQDNAYTACCLSRASELDALNVKRIQLEMQYATTGSVSDTNPEILAVQNDIETADMEYRTQC